MCICWGNPSFTILKSDDECLKPLSDLRVSCSLNVICDLIIEWEATTTEGSIEPYFPLVHCRVFQTHSCRVFWSEDDSHPSIHQSTDSEQVRRSFIPKRAKTGNRQRPTDIADDPPRTPRSMQHTKSAPRASVHSATATVSSGNLKATPVPCI